MSITSLAFTDLQTGEPAVSHIRQALNNGMHVSMTNKGPVALHYPELRQLALRKNVQIGIEGTVMSGTPSINLGNEMLLAAGITKVQGILNGTTNYILGEMSSGSGYEDALKQAQELGYAEADPTGDVEGYEVTAKVCIIGNILMNLSLTLDDIDCEGATNAITYSTESLGDIRLIGPGSGRLETGYTVIEDILSIHKKSLIRQYYLYNDIDVFRPFPPHNLIRD
jgi:homoserine dehydrogenase